MEKTTTDSFESLLAEFNKLVDKQPEIPTVKTKLEDIRKRAMFASLSGRQQEAIKARVDNYLSGSYGRNLSKKPNPQSEK